MTQGKKTLETVFEYPVPEGANITGVAVDTGDLRLEGMLVPRTEARRIAQAIRFETGENLPAALSEGSLFRLPVFPVLAGRDTIVTLSWLADEPPPTYPGPVPMWPV